MKWVLAESDETAVAALARDLGLHPLIARLMAIRHITDPEEARSFLACDLSSLSDPGIFSHMQKAVDRIRSAIVDGEKIVVYGDYDVDGVTGTSILYLVLKELGAVVDHYIPDRMAEGYGLNKSALETIKTSGAGVVISVDCGITALQEATFARASGLDLIITDHHEFEHAPGQDNSREGLIRIPDAFAILHPTLLSPGVSEAHSESVKVLTGVGVAFKLAQALLGVSAEDSRLKSFLDLVALGTVADVGKIAGENRVLVKHGLDLLSSDTVNRPGIAALKQVTKLSGKRIQVGSIGFTLAPRINASGRLVRADTAFHLLTTASVEMASELAAELDDVNKQRQEVEEGIWDDAKNMCSRLDIGSVGALVLASGAWHQGVIGIVASRLVEEFFRPVALISVQDGVGKGSARSIPGFNLYEGLVECSDLLLGFGGHKYAAGFTIAQENIVRFSERISAIVHKRIGPEGFTRTLSVDAPVALEELTADLIQEIERMSPFGQGNPEPRLGSRGLDVVSARIVGNNHLKLRLKQGNSRTLDAIAFKRGDHLGNKVREGARLAAVFTPRLNVWNGTTTVQLDIKDLKPDA